MNIGPETIKLLEENMGDIHFDIDLGDEVFGFDTKTTGNKSKNKQVVLYQTKRFLRSKGNHEQNEKLTAVMGVAQRVECSLMKQKVTSSIPSQGTRIYCWDICEKQSIVVSLSH